MSDMEKTKAEQKPPKITSESVREFTDEELNKVAGGVNAEELKDLLSKNPNALWDGTLCPPECIWQDGKCIC